MPCGAWRETVFRHLQELHNMGNHNMSLSTAHLLDQCITDSLSRYHRNSQLSQSLPWLFRADVVPLNVNYRSAFPNASSPSLLRACLFACSVIHAKKARSQNHSQRILINSGYLNSSGELSEFTCFLSRAKRR